MEGRLLLDVVVAERAAILELLAGEDQALLVGGNAAPRPREQTGHGDREPANALTPPCPGSWP